MPVLTIYAHHNPRFLCHAVHGAAAATPETYLGRACVLGKSFGD